MDNGNGKGGAKELVTKGGLMPAQLDIIRDAITKGANLENLSKLLEIQERWEANEARKHYHIAMAAFKANPPEIEKDKKVAYLNVKFSHATLANVTKKINEALSRNGLSASWKVSQDGQIAVTCRITHEKGHSEETTLRAGPDASGSKNSIQAIGSTISYLERYTLLALTGMATEDMDDDGKESGKREPSGSMMPKPTAPVVTPEVVNTPMVTKPKEPADHLTGFKTSVVYLDSVVQTTRKSKEGKPVAVLLVKSTNKDTFYTLGVDVAGVAKGYAEQGLQVSIVSEADEIGNRIVSLDEVEDAING